MCRRARAAVERSIAHKLNEAADWSRPLCGVYIRWNTAKMNASHQEGRVRIAEPVPSVRDSGFPTRDEIARLAYSHWESRGKPEGSDQDDWFRAVDELRARRQGGNTPQERTSSRLRLAVVELPGAGECPSP